MIRTPLINASLGALRTAQQVLSGRNAFQELAEIEVQRSQSVDKSSHDPSPSPLQLYDVSSGALWWLACWQSKRRLEQGDVTELSRLSFLVTLGGKLQQLGPLGGLSYRMANRHMQKYMHSAVRSALDNGQVVPGAKNGLSARVMLLSKVDETTAQLFEKELAARKGFSQVLMKAFKDGQKLQLSEAELQGVPEQLKKRWKGWGGFKVPVGREAMNIIMPYCSVGSTRSQVFEAYYRRFGPDFHASALELLRTRQKLAKQLGFNSWADYELRPLAEVAQDGKSAARLLQDCWKQLQPCLARSLQEMKRAGGASQHSEAYHWMRQSRGTDSFKLAEFLPAEPALERLMEVLGRSCNVTFRALPSRSWLQTGWHGGVRCFEVVDGPPVGLAAGEGRCLGYVYVELYMSWKGTRPLAPGALLLAPGHVHLGLNLQAPSVGATKLLTPDDAVMIAHELGHAVHMLCFKGSSQQFYDLPLDVLELSSTFAEVLATQPQVVGEYARHHASEGLPPDNLIQVVQQGPHFFMQKLQSWNVGLGLQSDFDALDATPSELQDYAVKLWQQFSLVPASSSFSPLGDDAGGCLALGANHVAYMLCYLRSALLLKTSGKASPNAKRWLSPDFAGSLRSQLLDQTFNSERLATLSPTLQVAGQQLPHPLPPLPSDRKFSLFQQFRS